MIVYDLNNRENKIYEADKYIKASGSEYEYYSQFDGMVTAYYKTNETEENIHECHRYSFLKINGNLYESVGIGKMEDTVSIVKGKEKITMGIKSFYEYKKQFAPKEKPKILEQLQLF